MSTFRNSLLENLYRSIIWFTNNFIVDSLKIFICKILNLFYHPSFLLQVHKKIYVPLSGLFQRGRLYKAQSCGSIVRDKVNQNPNGSGGGRGGGGSGAGGANSNARHSTIFNEKHRFKNCLSGTRLLGSDGDINHNGNSFITAAAAMSNGSVSPAELVVATGGATSPVCGLATGGARPTASVPIKTA